MINDSLLQKFIDQFDNLKRVVAASSARSIEDPPDPLFYENQNVFVKSYLVSACSMLEAFIQDLAIAYIDNIQARINAANLPFNFVVWTVGHEKANLDFKSFESAKGKKDISDIISPNYGKTVKAFQKIGVDLSSSDAQAHKDFISSIVEKRNKIVHYNDEALDLSFSDVMSVIDRFKDYCKCLYMAVSDSPHLKC
ncbi:hypothetical protein FHW79_006460 [Azospirillum sp. OGB3]|uniref:HEPN domain-containing protein n=1 Tax=Azospirillum sp. OGB3 TaxID=2587012 RepID=UPI00160617BC|nr:HEPN domain-containing protein [Azospirillum sp. OGB3]MBB3268784.1 hypothetical protein [Azospirillum sp. OGB3]